MLRQQTSRTQCRRYGIAALWTILTLPIFILLICWVVESGRLHLARQQLTTALESAALAGAKTWCESDGSLDTLDGRDAAVEFAASNVVIDMSVVLATNYDPGAAPNENASCEGDLVFGTIREEIDGRRVFYAGLRAGCGNTDGPNAHATLQVSSDDWQTVTLCNRNYNCMVVVGTPVYTRAQRPMVVRIQNAGAGNSFDFIVQDTNSGAAIPNVPVHFFVVEEGVYTEADHGVKMEAVKYNSTVTDWRSSWVAEARAYNNAYARPVVVGQVMTFNDPNWSVFWSHGGNRQTPPGAQLFTGKHVGQDPNRVRADETIGYVIMDEGSGTINGLPYYASLGPDVVVGMLNGAPNTYALPGDIASHVVASQSAEDGGNGGWVVAYGPDPLQPASVDFGIDEFLLTDRRHTTEQISHIVLGGPCVVCAQAEVEVPWLCSLFGCVLPPARVQGEVYAMVDCEDRCPKLICVDEVVCP